MQHNYFSRPATQYQPPRNQQLSNQNTQNTQYNQNTQQPRIQQQNSQPRQLTKPLQTSQNVKIGESNTYIVYYSNYCLNSKEFINILCKTPVYNKFIKVNVSDANVNIPPFVKSVPTIIVPNVNRPLVGEEVFKWLDETSEKRINNVEEAINPYHPDEMDNNMGDNYSYLDFNDTEQPMEHNFVYIKKGEQKIETPPEDDYVSTKPKSVNDVNNVNRPPFPQAPQRQMTTDNHIIPQSSSVNDSNVNDAYNELLERRKINIQ